MPELGPSVTVLGIETSCDETAAAVVRLGPAGPEVVSNIVWSQMAEHAPFRGVVPEIAARAHVEKVDLAIAAAMEGAGIGFGALDAVAATAGPGLIGGVMVGLTAAKAVALAHDKPLIPINHLEGHALSPRLAAPAPFPYLLLLTSGGHCQFLLVEALGSYRRLGSTLDDAAGEAFDKVAKALGLGFPGGPAVERLARGGDPRRFDFPRPLKGRPGCDFSFAGLKTAVAREAEALGTLTAQDQADLCAGFQAAVVEVLVDRAGNALALSPGIDRLVIAGGVAANGPIRAALVGLCDDAGVSFSAPPLKYCTDNAAMIALAGAERLAAGLAPALMEGLSAPARARWPLDEAAAHARPTHKPGRKGAKA
jgi:N6-L-threonylcarbamoyladenine synthase